MWTLPIKIKTYDECAEYYKMYVEEKTVVETTAVKTAKRTPLTPSPSSPSTDTRTLPIKIENPNY
jgi:hypothetical protein